MPIVDVFTEEFKAQFEEYTTLLLHLAGASAPSYEERARKAEGMIEEYIKYTGVRPDYIQLDRISDLILFDDLRDSDPHKTKHNEYPILSSTQLDRRRFGGRGQDSNMSGETSLGAAQCVGADGRDYRYPNRRTRTIDELLHVDENARIRNKVRAAQYRKDTAPGPVITYNLNDTGGELTEEFTQYISMSRRLPECEQFVDPNVQIAA
ncbi:hypothetical protein D1872_70860 [compost metagenome]